MDKHCDNKSVGVIVRNQENELLLINRAKFPYGWASPAGHVDEHGTAEETAVAELKEETGLEISASALVKVIDNRRIDNKCRRLGGDHHYWTVFMVDAPTKIQFANNPDEVRDMAWFSKAKLEELAAQTRAIANPEEKHRSHILEQIWLDFFVELKLL